MNTLSYLVAKCDWEGVYQRLQVKPEEASIAIPIGSEVVVYALHQAICSNVKPIPQKVLLVMIKQFPNALDSNAFVGACENPQLSRGAIELLLNNSSPEIYQTIQHNAQHYTSIAIKRKNLCAVQLFIERFPRILDDSTLAHACEHGTAEMVEKILEAGFCRNISKGGGLFRKTSNKEDALDIAIRLYDEKDDERRNILITCLQYANAVKMGMRVLDPDYSVILASVGLVPRRILGSFLKLYAHEVTNTNQSGKYAIVKAIHMTTEESRGNTLPPIFRRKKLIYACSNGKLELVQNLLQKSAQHSFQEYEGAGSESVTCNEKNALDIAIDLFDENDATSCNIFRICIQYANAANLRKKAPSPNYPTILAAIGFVPLCGLQRIGKKYCHEIRKMDRTSKLAVEKVLRMSEDETKYAIRLDTRCQYPLSINPRRLKLSTSLERIPQ